MNKPILTPLDLSARILELKVKKDQQEEAMKLQFSQAMHSISPGNLIKTGFRKFTESPIGTGLIGTGLNLGVDYLSRKFLGTSGSSTKKLAARAVNYGVGAILGKKSEMIKAYAGVLLNRIIKGNKNKNEHSNIE